jgi:hypothetical protein
LGWAAWFLLVIEIKTREQLNKKPSKEVNLTGLE